VAQLLHGLRGISTPTNYQGGIADLLLIIELVEARDGQKESSS